MAENRQELFKSFPESYLNVFRRPSFKIKSGYFRQISTETEKWSFFLYHSALLKGSEGLERVGWLCKTMTGFEFGTFGDVARAVEEREESKKVFSRNNSVSCSLEPQTIKALQTENNPGRTWCRFKGCLKICLVWPGTEFWPNCQHDIYLLIHT